MSGVIGTSGTAVKMANTAGSTAVTIAAGVSISGTGAYGIGVYSSFFKSTSTIGSTAAIVGVAGQANAVFSESIVNNGFIGGTNYGIELVRPGNHVWSPASGSPANQYSTIFASATIVNNGTIHGQSIGVTIAPATPASVASGASVLTNNVGALIEGGYVGALYGTGVEIGASGRSASIVNAGTIISDSNYGDGVLFGGRVTNLSTGLISAANGLAIVAKATPVPSYVYNAGRVDGVVTLGLGGTVVNKGHATITGGANGVGASGATLAVNNAGLMGAINGFTVIATNSASGTIVATGINSIAVSGTNDAITNYGLISGISGAGGISVEGVGPVLNASGATINANARFAVGVYGGSTALITNNGFIWGAVEFIQGTSPNTLVNTGTILADSSATGSISTFNGQAIKLETSGNTTITNAAGGTISAGTVNGGAMYAIGVAGAHTAFITNQGLIAGEVEFGAGTASSTLVNAGTIGVSGASYAVSFAAGSHDRLVVDPGAQFIGGGNGGNTIGSSYVSTVEFAAGSGSASGFGTKIVNFAQISLDHGANWLLSGSAAGWNGETVTGLDGSTIELAGTVASLSSFSGNALALSGGTTINIMGSYAQSQIGVTNDGTNTYITACFAEGTNIATARGPVAVETLVVGDLALTASGRLARIKWLGHRRTDLARHPRPHDVMPVRVRADAFGPGAPFQDLVLSPDHAVFQGGALVPIRHLVNGTSIVQERRRTVTYWHVELDRHDVILAEGLACESFLDTGNRAAFANAEGATQLHPEFARAVWAAAGCAPIHTDPADPALRALHLRLLARAARQPACNAAITASRTA